jgi:hypothetical protein
MSDGRLGFRVAPGKKKLLEELVEEGRIKNITDGLNEGLTLLLQLHGKLSVPERVEAREA